MSLLAPCPRCRGNRKADEGHRFCRECEGLRQPKGLDRLRILATECRAFGMGSVATELELLADEWNEERRQATYAVEDEMRRMPR